MLIEIPTFVYKREGDIAGWVPNGVLSINPRYVVSVADVQENNTWHKHGARSMVTMISVTSNQSEDSTAMDSDVYSCPWTRAQVAAALTGNAEAATEANDGA